MSELQQAQAKSYRANRRFKRALYFFFAFLFGIILYSAIEIYDVQQTIAKNQATNAQASNDRFVRYEADNAAEHQKTQQYVRCIAQVLLLPIGDRTNAAFDKCSVSGTYNGKSSGATSGATDGSQPVTLQSTAPATKQPKATAPTSNKPVKTTPPTTTTAPPDPDILHRIPVVGSILKHLGL